MRTAFAVGPSCNSAWDRHSGRIPASRCSVRLGDGGDTRCRFGVGQPLRGRSQIVAVQRPDEQDDDGEQYHRQEGGDGEQQPPDDSARTGI